MKDYTANIQLFRNDSKYFLFYINGNVSDYENLKPFGQLFLKGAAIWQQHSSHIFGNINII